MCTSMYSYLTIPKHTAAFSTGCFFYIAHPDDQWSFCTPIQDSRIIQNSTPSTKQKSSKPKVFEGLPQYIL